MERQAIFIPWAQPCGVKHQNNLDWRNPPEAVTERELMWVWVSEGQATLGLGLGGARQHWVWVIFVGSRPVIGCKLEECGCKRNVRREED